MARGDNKCAACGEFAGRSHQCATPAPRSPATIAEAPTTPTTNIDRDTVSDRVTRAQASLNTDSTPRPTPDAITEYRLTDSVGRARQANLLSSTNAATIDRMISGEPASEADTVTAAIEFSNAMTTLAGRDAEEMQTEDPEYVPDVAFELTERITAVQDLTTLMTDRELSLAARRINNWTPDAADRMITASNGEYRKNSLFKNAEAPFEHERNIFGNSLNS